ncbi:MAG TPA: ABC transporter ATP-binding protein, partial [Planctomycetota bacterium]|nr:ABC transporter ATP-binding protein [Planctomycetota bacterium]
MSRLELDRVTVTYGARTALDDVTLEIESGEVLAVIGPNGSGKTTLVRAISGVASLARGAIRLDGEDLARLGAKARARRVAVVPQGARVPVGITVADLVLLGRTPHQSVWGHATRSDREAARRAIERVGVEPLADRFTTEVSGGELQRAIIARALAQSPRVLLLDEATAQLDVRQELSILALARTLAREDGLIVIATLHDLLLAGRFADRVAVLAGGRLRATGRPDATLVPEVLEPVYDVGFQVIAHPDLGVPIVLPELPRERE